MNEPWRLEVLSREEFENAYVSGAFEGSRFDDLLQRDKQRWRETAATPTIVEASPVPRDRTSPSRSPGEAGREARRLAEARKQVVDDAMRLVEMEELAQASLEKQRQQKKGYDDFYETQAERETRVRKKAMDRAWEQANKVSGDSFAEQVSPFVPKNAFLLVVVWLFYLILVDLRLL